jgi:site-specific DNA recombinase
MRQATVALDEQPTLVAIYERVSSDEQREKETIQTQTFLVERYLSDHPELTVRERYLDDGVSGSIPLAQRPRGQKLVQDAMAGRFQKLVVTRGDRLGRDARDLLGVFVLFESLGIELVGIAEPLDDYLTFGVKAVVSDHEKRRFLERSAEGTERVVRQGYFPGGIVPLGYALDGGKPHQKLVLSELPMWQDMTEAGVVRWIYDRLAIDRWSCPRVARELNALGVPTVYAKDRRYVRGQRTEEKWRAGRIANMVKNSVYRGQYLYGKRNKAREPIPVGVPRLVSDEIWYAAQETLASNFIMAKNTTHRFLLRSLLYCGNCGHRYSGAWHRNCARYRCNGGLGHKFENGERCLGKEIKGDHLEKPIMADVECFLRHPGDEVLEALLRELEGMTERPEDQVRRTNLESALAEREKEKQRLLRAYVKEVITLEEFEMERVDIDLAIATLEEGISALQPEDEPEVLNISASDLLERIRTRLDDGLSEEEWHEVIRLLVKRITVETTLDESGAKRVRATVTYRFPVSVHTSLDRDSWRPPLCRPPETPTFHCACRQSRILPRAAAGEPRAYRERIPAVRPGTTRHGAQD